MRMVDPIRLEKSNLPFIDDRTTTLDPLFYLNITEFSDEITTVAGNQETLRLTRFIVQRIVVPVVVIIGLSGNLISIAVLTNPSMKSSTNCYLTFLAIFDCLYLICSFTLSFKHYPGIKDEVIYKYWFPYGRVLSDISSNASVILTVTFTVERYIAVCHPMKGRVICTPKRARMIATFMALTAVACTFPEFFEWEVISTISADGNETTTKIVMTEFAQDDSYSIGYYYFIAIGFTFIPLLALCTFNSILIRSVFKANEMRKVMTNTTAMRSGDRRQWEQHKTTLMLVGVAAVFIICQLPSATLIVYSTYRDLFDIQLSTYELNNLRIAGNISNILIQINAAMNFILYSAMSTKFRRVFVRMLYRLVPCKEHMNVYKGTTFYSGVSFTKTANGKQKMNVNGLLPPLKRNLPSSLHPNRRYDTPLTSMSACDSRDNINYSSDSVVMKDRICINDVHYSASLSTSV